MDLDGKRLEITAILQNWQEAYEDPAFYPEEYYKVQTTDNRIYLLRYSVCFKSWWVREYKGAAA